MIAAVGLVMNQPLSVEKNYIVYSLYYIFIIIIIIIIISSSVSSISISFGVLLNSLSQPSNLPFCPFLLSIPLGEKG